MDALADCDRLLLAQVAIGDHLFQRALAGEGGLAFPAGARRPGRAVNSASTDGEIGF